MARGDDLTGLAATRRTRFDRDERIFLVALFAAGILLSATVVPGVFIIDEDNYLVTLVALRHGQLAVLGTEGLPPSPELLFFDPHIKAWEVTSTPVTSRAPPLWAALALPFSPFGWRGLVLLNTLAFLGAAALLFVYVRRLASGSAPWLAATAWVLGSYALEYAQGVWPHMLSSALVLGGFVLASRVRDGATVRLAFGAGLLLGLATGVRYPNAVLAAGVGAGLVVRPLRRALAAVGWYAAGVAGPVAVAAAINFARLGSMNPVSKGPGYTTLRGTEGGVVEVLTTLWSIVLDYSVRPTSILTSQFYLSKHLETGAFFLHAGALKKAWLQSAPWVGFALVALLAAWAWRRPSPHRRELRAATLLVFPLVAMYSVAGLRRHDGLCANQRYLLDLMPIAAAVLSIALAGIKLERVPLLLGALAACAAVALAAPLAPDDPRRHLLLLKAPLGLAALAAIAFVARGTRPGRALLSPVLGASLAWALAVHLSDDLPLARTRRTASHQRAEALGALLPDRSALFARAPAKDAFGPLMLDRDLVVLDPWPDSGRTAPALTEALLGAGRRVFVYTESMSAALQSVIAGGRAMELRGELRNDPDGPSGRILEVVPR